MSVELPYSIQYNKNIVTSMKPAETDPLSLVSKQIMVEGGHRCLKGDSAAPKSACANWVLKLQIHFAVLPLAQTSPSIDT